jgi:Ca2+-binding EF-hand superfamily protein
MIRASLVTCVIAFVVAVPVYSQTGARIEQSFEEADANNDGVVSREEYRKARAQKFSRLDRNGDGYFDQSDIPKRRMGRKGGGERIEQLRDQFDSNNDQRISESEFANGPTLAFDRADKDGNGLLTAQEIEAAKAALKNARQR